MQQPFARTALAAALLALGFGASAQTGTQSTAPSAQQKSAKPQPSAPRDAASSGSKSADGATRPAGADAKAATLSGGERKFMEKAAAHGLAEVELGRLAQDKATREEVKQFAQRMVQDHGKANEELKQVASAKGVELPAAPDKSHQKKMEKMQKLSGDQFDREYMKDMVKDHKNDVSEFRKQAKGAKDSQVKEFAAKTLPTLEEHLKLAQATEKAVAAGAKGGSGASSKGKSASAPGSDRERVASTGSGGAPGTGKSPSAGGSGLK
jgi:putative membrane protein